LKIFEGSWNPKPEFYGGGGGAVSQRVHMETMGLHKELGSVMGLPLEYWRPLSFSLLYGVLEFHFPI